MNITIVPTSDSEVIFISGKSALHEPITPTEATVPPVITSARDIIECVQGSSPATAITSALSETSAKSDNLISLEKLVHEIMKFHEKAEACEIEASIYAWESGIRLNQAYDRVYSDDGYGGWGRFIEKEFSKMGRTTVWRYRKLATCFTLEQVTGKTLSELYEAMKVAKFEDEPVAEPRQVDKHPHALSVDFPSFSKAWEKLDIPDTLSQPEKAAVRRVCSKLEEAYDKIEKPSILRINWEAKLVKGVTEWTEEERNLFISEFARMQAVYQALQALQETT
jgi:hypothetical protein